ncbi:MAG: phage baseplate protein, partial [Xenococcaceae cyanobacterium]
MRYLAANDILHIWEIGQNQHPLDRALTMLAVAMPDRTTDELARLSIGRRDSLLLRLREITLGQHLVSVAQCPQCGEQLELEMNVRDFQIVD